MWRHTTDDLEFCMSVKFCRWNRISNGSRDHSHRSYTTTNREKQRKPLNVFGVLWCSQRLRNSRPRSTRMTGIFTRPPQYCCFINIGQTVVFWTKKARLCVSLDVNRWKSAEMVPFATIRNRNICKFHCLSMSTVAKFAKHPKNGIIVSENILLYIFASDSKLLLPL